MRSKARLIRISASMLFAAALLIPLATAQVMTSSVSPAIVDAKTTTNVTVTADFLEAPIPSTVVLQQLDGDGYIVNPKLGALTMLSPTSYSITYPVFMDEGSLQLQVSAGFADREEREISGVTVVAGCRADRHSTLAVCFGGNFPIQYDHIVTDSSGVEMGADNFLQNPMYQNNAALSKSVGYASGDTMMVNIRFSLPPAAKVALETVTITGVIGDCPVGPTQFTIENVTLPAGRSVLVTNIAADYPLEASLERFCPAMKIDWSYAGKGQEPTSLGQSVNPLYVTFGKPLAAVQLTSLFHATSAVIAPGEMVAAAREVALAVAAPQTAQDVVDMVWKRFTGVDLTTSSDRKLYYYPADTPFGSCRMTGKDLLLSPSGAGRCGAFADLLLLDLSANGIRGVKVRVTPKKGIGFLVNNWTFNGDGPYKLVLKQDRDERVEIFDMIPQPDKENPTTFGDLTNDKGLPGQNSPTPSQKIFADHAIVKFDKTYYDPSYGVTYSDPADFIKKAVAGYLQKNLGVKAGLRSFSAVPVGSIENNIRFSQ